MFWRRFLKFFFNRTELLYRWGKRSFNDVLSHQTQYFILHLLERLYHFSNVSIVALTLPALGLIIYDFGFFPFYSTDTLLYRLLFVVFLAFKIFYSVRFLSYLTQGKKIKVHAYNFFLVLLVFYLAATITSIVARGGAISTDFLIEKFVLYLGIAFLFFNEVSNLLKFIYQKRQNTAFIFITSFAVVIIVGMLLLMLPKATTGGISPVDALFTSASAVCVTGLIVVDTAKDFTIIGQIIILFLIQIGGLGMMTFTGLLGYLAAGSVSFHNQMALKSMVSSTRISNVLTMVTRIIVVTLFFELIGAVFLYFSLDRELFADNRERIFFAVFHSVSGFCNAGFSTLTDGLYDESMRFNYSLQMILAVLIILGGMGFPIVFNIFSYIRTKTVKFFARMTKSVTRDNFTRVLQVNSKLAIGTTITLLIIGFVSYLVFEFDGTLRDHPTAMGKIVTAFFGAVTPRTAGFNTVNMAALSLPMIMLYLLLMWIGASPSSTGGGIKTTTAAVAFLNLRSVIFNKNRTEVFRTQISEQSINRAFAVMLLSLLFIGLTVLLISIYDGEKGILNISFEAFSAFSTVGLSLGITADLSYVSKIVLVFCMFIGRVGALTVLMAFVNRARTQSYHYPVEEIMY